MRKGMAQNNGLASLRSQSFTQILMKRVTCIKNSEGMPYCIFKKDTESKVFDLSSVEFRNEISNLYYEIHGEFIEPMEARRNIDGIIALACQSKDERTVGTRVIQEQDRLIYNLDNDNKIVVITEDFVKIVDNSDCKSLFIHTQQMKSQVEPDLTAQPEVLMPLIKELFIIDEQQYLLLTVYLCTLFVKDIQHPLLVAYGDYGAGKSTALKTITSIIDPTKKDLLYLNKSNIRDLQVALTKNYYTAFDNVKGKLSDDVMNMFCQVVTGGNISIRRLYTTNDEIVLSLQRCLAMNGTDVIGTRNDLLDRSLLLKFKRMSENRALSEEAYAVKLNKCLPLILGAIFNILSKAMKLHNSSSYSLPKKPRMLAWTEWGYCIAESIKTGYGDMFVHDYCDNLSGSNNITIDENPYISCIVKYIKEHGSFKGSSTDFLEKIIDYAANNGYDFRNKAFPSCNTQVWQKMKDYRVTLKSVGIAIYEPVNVGKYREIKILLEEK